MAVNQLTPGASGTNSSSYVTASVSPTANRLLLLFVSNATGSAANNHPSSISGNGLTWVQIKTASPDNSISVRQLAVWGALTGASPSSGAITITFPGAVETCQWKVVETDEFDATAPDVASLIVQAVASTPAVTVTPTVSLASFADAVNNLAIGHSALPTATTFTPDSGFTEIGAEQAGTSPTTTMGAQYRIGEDTSVVFTFGGSTTNLVSAIAIEIDKGAGGGSPSATRARLSFAELEVPFLATRGRVSFGEFEVPLVGTRGRASFAEFEVPSVSTRGRLSFTEFETPSIATRGRLAFTELEVPLVGTRGLLSWTELEVPIAPTIGRLSFTELEVPALAGPDPTKGFLSWTELEVPLVATRGRLAWTELEVPLVGTRGRLAFVELETPLGATRGLVSFTEAEFPSAPAAGLISFLELRVPDVGEIVAVRRYIMGQRIPLVSRRV